MASTSEKRDREPSAPDAAPSAGLSDSGNGGSDGKLASLASEGEDSLQALMASNFIEFASYVIRDRAIPDVCDGLKPVQRRILHSLHVMDDGRFHKVANVIGHTMQYHPHGDASIGSALVVLANKEYFIEKQGNFGNLLTGDQASAARYIECRLTPLAREVLFNDEITEFVDSYDGRNREPVCLPAKVPAVLMLGVEGIAVGMTTRILPHNFRELLKAQIAYLKGRSCKLFPDFVSGGTMDVGEYDDGKGKVKVRASIDIKDDKTLVVREIPATTTTESLIASVEEASRRGKIKIGGISDYTGENVEIEISLPRGTHAKDTIKRLYGYTECEVSISSNIVVIHDNHPRQMTVTEVLQLVTDRLVDDLRHELEIQLQKLRDRFHEKTLAQIFIENRIYKRIEECDTYDLVLAEVRKGLEKFRDMLTRDVTDEDIERLLQIQIRRISRFDINKNREELDNILHGIEVTEHDLEHLTDYAISYIEKLLDKYGGQYPRRTRITDLEQIDVREVALKNLRVGHDRLGHFLGTEVRNSNKNEEPLVCTEFDRLVLLRNDGSYRVIPVPDRLYVGPVKYVLKAEKGRVYSMIYRDRKRGSYHAKRFRIDRYVMEREYQTTPANCIIEALYLNQGVVVRCSYKPNKRLREPYLDVDFDSIEIRSTKARGFRIAGHPIENFAQLRRGSPEPVGDGDAGDDHSGVSAAQEAAASSEDVDASAETDVAEAAVSESAAREEPPVEPRKEASVADETPAVGEGARTVVARKKPGRISGRGDKKPKRKRMENSGPAAADDGPEAAAEPTVSKARIAAEWEQKGAKASGGRSRAGGEPAERGPAPRDETVEPETAGAPSPDESAEGLPDKLRKAGQRSSGRGKKAGSAVAVRAKRGDKTGGRTAVDTHAAETTTSTKGPQTTPVDTDADQRKQDVEGAAAGTRAASAPQRKAEERVSARGTKEPTESGAVPDCTNAKKLIDEETPFFLE